MTYVYLPNAVLFLSSICYLNYWILTHDTKTHHQRCFKTKLLIFYCNLQRIDLTNLLLLSFKLVSLFYNLNDTRKYEILAIFLYFLGWRDLWGMKGILKGWKMSSKWTVERSWRKWNSNYFNITYIGMSLPKHLTETSVIIFIRDWAFYWNAFVDRF